MVAIIPPVAQPAYLTIPDSFCKGEKFEDFVRQNLFPKETYKLIHHSAGYNQDAKDFQKSSLKPDFTFTDAATKQNFYVECKFRTALIANSFQFSKGYQLERYKTYADLPFFLVLGLGGKPDQPSQVFLLNFQQSQFVMLSKRHILGKEIEKNQPVSSTKLWGLHILQQQQYQASA